MIAYELANIIGAKPIGKGYIIRCPIHDDNPPLYNFMIVNTTGASTYILSAIQVAPIKTYKNTIELVEYSQD